MKQNCYIFQNLPLSSTHFYKTLKINKVRYAIMYPRKQQGYKVVKTNELKGKSKA